MHPNFALVSAFRGILRQSSQRSLIDKIQNQLYIGFCRIQPHINNNRQNRSINAQKFNDF
jgi:hypothetical protein